MPESPVIFGLIGVGLALLTAIIFVRSSCSNRARRDGPRVAYTYICSALACAGIAARFAFEFNAPALLAVPALARTPQADWSGGQNRPLGEYGRWSCSLQRSYPEDRGHGIHSGSTTVPNT